MPSPCYSSSDILSFYYYYFPLSQFALVSSPREISRQPPNLHDPSFPSVRAIAAVSVRNLETFSFHPNQDLGKIPRNMGARIWCPDCGKIRKWGLRCGPTIQAIHQPQLRIELPRVTLIPSTGAISRPNLSSFLVYFMRFCAIGLFKGVYGAVSWDFVFLW